MSMVLAMALVALGVTILGWLGVYMAYKLIVAPEGSWEATAAAQRSRCLGCGQAMVITPPGEPIRVCSECWMRQMEAGRSAQHWEDLNG